MRDQLKNYIDKLFEGTVNTQQARDFHDELLSNVLDRYNEELSNGRTEQEAYRISVLSLGNAEELLKPFYPKRENTRSLRTVAIILYITSVIPVILFGAMHVVPSTLGVTIMFLIIAVATALMILSGRNNPSEEAENARILRAIGVAMIIAGIGLVVFGAGYDEIRLVRILPVDGAVLGVCGMFIAIAMGIALIVTAASKDTKRTVPNIPVASASQTNAGTRQASGNPAPQQMKPALPKGIRIAGGILTAIYWVFTVMIYLSISLTTGNWFYTWLIFLVAAGLYEIVSSVVHLCFGLPWLSRFLGGILLLAATFIFYYLTKTTGMWYLTWLIFPIEACIKGVLDGIITLVKTSGKETVQ